MTNPEVAALLGLPPRVFAVFGMCVGYPDPAHAAAVKPRLPQPSVLHHETYHLASQDQAIADYNEVMKTFYTQQQMNVPEDWSEHSAQAGCEFQVFIWARSPALKHYFTLASSCGNICHYPLAHNIRVLFNRAQCRQRFFLRVR